LLALAAAPLIAYFALRIYRDRRYARGFRERLGSIPFIQRTPAGAIWLHAVSVGEVLSSTSLLKALRQEYPTAPLYVSCSTLAGRSIAEEKLAPLVDGLFYAPLDYALFVRRMLRRLRPSLVVVMETEIWPNLYRETKRYGAALAIVNGRISDRAFPRYRPWSWFFSAVLGHVDELLVQSEQDRRRYVALGAPADRVHSAGNLKYDFNPAEGRIPDEIAAWMQNVAPQKIWIAASTMPPRESGDIDEDDLVIDAIREVSRRQPGLLTILVPRRPERFDSAAAKLEDARVPFARRSELPAVAALPAPCVLLLDSMGELSRLFAVADVVFMGGTFAQRGGHNILEPAYFGKAVIAGPHMENFAAIASEFTEAGALYRVNGPADLAGAVNHLLDSRDERFEIGERARRLAEAKRGVTQRIASRLMDRYFGTLPLDPGPAILAPLAFLWETETARRKRAFANRRRLPRPVISVGNITVGGAGKTPFVDWLSHELKRVGIRPAILTRGYRRKFTGRIAVVPAGAVASPELTGDEPQIYVRRGIAHVGVGADRYASGSALLKSLDADVFVLDDAFQHWPLYRDINVVLIDSLNPFGGGAVFPHGRLREPLDALARADVFVITRVEPGFRTDSIENVLRRYNNYAPVLRSRVVARGWREVFSGRFSERAPFASAAAFCGLANPRSLWLTLDREGIDVRFRWAFDDHHRYRMTEVRRLARAARDARVEAIITTEKDVPNLPADARQLLAPLPLYALEIGVEVDNPELLLDAVVPRSLNR
jgi:tetraacyldisaccharide 4'-kinase